MWADLVPIVLGLAAIVASVFVLRWAWNSRKREGGTAERAEALEDAVIEAAGREESARTERGKSHEKWKSEGRARRARRRKP